MIIINYDILQISWYIWSLYPIFSVYFIIQKIHSELVLFFYFFIVIQFIFII